MVIVWVQIIYFLVSMIQQLYLSLPELPALFVLLSPCLLSRQRYINVTFINMLTHITPERSMTSIPTLISATIIGICYRSLIDPSNCRCFCSTPREWWSMCFIFFDWFVFYSILYEFTKWFGFIYTLNYFSFTFAFF